MAKHKTGMMHTEEPWWSWKILGKAVCRPEKRKLLSSKFASFASQLKGIVGQNSSGESSACRQTSGPGTWMRSFKDGQNVQVVSAADTQSSEVNGRSCCWWSKGRGREHTSEACLLAGCWCYQFGSILEERRKRDGRVRRVRAAESGETFPFLNPLQFLHSSSNIQTAFPQVGSTTNQPAATRSRSSIHHTAFNGAASSQATFWILPLSPPTTTAHPLARCHRLAGSVSHRQSECDTWGR